MPRRPSRLLPSGLRALLPGRSRKARRATPLPRPGRPRRAAAARPVAGTWHSGLHVGLGGARAYDVYVPAGLRRRAAPLVLLLHGCGQSPTEFVDATRFVAAADRSGFLLVLPHQQAQHHPRRCWNWYEAAHQRRGTGEPGLLAGLVAHVGAEEVRWRVDPRRVYVTGLSAGGAMALTLAATYPDVFAAAGVHSAPAFRSSGRASHAFAAMAGRTPVPAPEPGAPAIAPIVVVQGADDGVVAAANGDRVTDQWLAHRAAAGADPVGPGRSRAGTSTDGRSYRVCRWYTTRRRTVLEYWLVEGLGHAWSGGRPGGSFSDPAGPRATTLMWTFFKRHALDERVPAGRAVGA